MRKVFSNSSECLHIYAQQTQDEGRASSVSFNRNKVYSYSQCIGNIQGNNIFLINYNYSVTTSKHNSWLNQAVSHYNRISINHPESPESEDNIKDFERQFNSIIDKLAKAKKPEIYTDELGRLQGTINRYLNAIPKLNKSYKKRLAKITDKNVLDSNLLEKTKERLKKQAEIAKVKIAESIKEFKSFERDYIYNSKLSYLRIKGDNVETSQGVTIEKSKVIPLAIIYKKWLETKEDGLLSHLLGKHIDYYTINSIDEKFVNIGCHKIESSEILSVFS